MLLEIAELDRVEIRMSGRWARDKHVTGAWRNKMKNRDKDVRDIWNIAVFQLNGIGVSEWRENRGCHI